jgi:hypothetical protein
MSQNKKLGFWSSRQAVAILAVSDIKPSRFAYDLLARLDAGSLTYEGAKVEILKRANAKSLHFIPPKTK